MSIPFSFPTLQITELAPFLPSVATELLPTMSMRLISRIWARAVRDLYIAEQPQ